MALFLATDDANLGAPMATAGPREAFVSIAPESCVVDATVAPPVYTFSRFDYSWLALALASASNSDRVPEFFDQIMVGAHTLTWAAMHTIVSHAINAGFTVTEPTDIVHAVKLALAWSESNMAALRVLQVGDFELLPAMPRSAGAAWWRSTPFSLWICDSLLQALCHLYGYSGAFWDAPSRAADSRLHLCMSLTQEFIPVSASLPAILHGEPAARFYLTTMLPHRFLRFPTGVPGLLTALTIRWGYFHGTSVQASSTLQALLPHMIKECPNLRRFLQPSLGVSSQVAAFMIILGVFAPSAPAHRFETFLQLDKKLVSYLTLAEQADASDLAVQCDVRAIMLRDAVEAERVAIASAPKVDAGGAKGDRESPATQTVITALMKLRGEPFLSNLERRLEQLWTTAQQQPTEVFTAALASRSLTCIAILFSNLTGVREAGSVYDILEQASHHRLQYITYRLATAEGDTTRPDHTRWFSYSLRIDSCVRSSDFDVFKKINFLELGAQVRRLREKVRYDPAHLPKAGQEFSFECFQEHLLLLYFIQHWLETLGFDLWGKHSFLEAMRVFSLFCQHGLHYRGRARDLHRDHMRQLYQALLADLHSGMKPFWKDAHLVYNHLMVADALFPADGAFYAAHRDLKLEVAEQDRLAHMGYMPQHPGSPLSGGGQRAAGFDPASPFRTEGASGQQERGGKPAFTELGSFAYAVKEDANVISISGVRYAKGLILEKLNLKEEEICLPTYLSRKGVAACPYAHRPGHERADSALHMFSDTAVALRPTFEQSPFRLPRDDGPSLRNAERGRGNQGRAGGRGGGRAQGVSSK